MRDLAQKLEYFDTECRSNLAAFNETLSMFQSLKPGKDWRDYL